MSISEHVSQCTWNRNDFKLNAKLSRVLQLLEIVHKTVGFGLQSFRVSTKTIILLAKRGKMKSIFFVPRSRLVEYSSFIFLLPSFT